MIETPKMNAQMSSTLDPTKKLDQICRGMLEHVIENEVRKRPHIAWVSKNQILWGNGVHWKETDRTLGAGLLKHAGIRRPSEKDLNVQILKTGYCQAFPPPPLNPILLNTTRKHLIKPCLYGEDYTDVRFLFGYGYIDESGKLDPKYPKGISGYFFYLADREYRRTQQRWLEQQPMWMRKQWYRCSETFIPAVTDQINSGERKSRINQVLLTHIEFRQLDPKLSEDEIEWLKSDRKKAA